jgi:hypothetical protein
MFSFSKNKILNNHLPLRRGRFPECHWRLKDNSLSFLSDCVKDILKDTGNPSVEGLEILKLARRKGVYRIVHPDDSSQSYIVKIFFLHHLSHRLSAHKYALDEAVNFITASNRGVKTPELLAFGQYYARSGLIKTGVFVTEDLRGYSTIGELLAKSDESQRSELLTRIIPVFQSLYLSGCNHIDININAIMLSEDKSNKNVFLLDFQHAIFYGESNLKILMFEAGYFARCCRKLISSDMAYAWVDEVLACNGVTCPDELSEAKDLFDYYFQCVGRTPTQTRLSRKHRKKIR